MENDILIIGKEQVQSLIDRLPDSSQVAYCTEEINRMLQIKSTLAWRADVGS